MILYLCNGFVSVIVLLNLVIAMMGYTFALVWADAYKQVDPTVCTGEFDVRIVRCDFVVVPYL